ncbi:MAG: PIN domain-containing protein [bacterium]
MRLTVDANVWIGALDIRDPACAACRACLLKAAEHSAVLYSPLLLPVEVSATVSRKTRDARQGLLAVRWVRGFVGHLWQPLSEECAEEAERLAASLYLCGADAVYVAVAHQSEAVLLTCDAEVIERAAKTVRVMTPAAWLRLSDKRR